MEDLSGYGWKNHYRPLLWASGLFTVAFIGFCLAWHNVDWRYLIMCIPFYLAVRYAQ